MKEKIERTTLHYIIGGSIPMMLLMPFLIECIHTGYHSITGENLSRFDGIVLSSFGYFILFTIIFTAGLLKCIKKGEKELGKTFASYYLYSSVYLLGSLYFLFSIFHFPFLLCLLLPIFIFVAMLLLYKTILKKL